MSCLLDTMALTEQTARRPVEGCLARAAVCARHEAERRSASVVDALIAAATIVHDLTLVTRNVRDFEHGGCRVLSPWSA